MIKIATMGDNVVDCYVSRGEMFPGGNCLNVSVFTRRFGAETAYIGAIGRDPAGDVILSVLQQEDVGVSRLRRIDGPTAYCVIGHRDGDRVFESFDLGVSMFQPDEGDFEFLQGFSAVHVGQSSGLDRHLERAAGCTRLSYDFSTRRDAGHRKSIAHFCFLASVSGSGFAPAEIESVSEDLLAGGAKWVLVTRGRDGATLWGSGGKFAVMAAPVEAVDTLGAGDSFIARTLYGLVAGEEPFKLLQAASIAAAETCRHYGAVGHGRPIDVPALARR